MNRLTVKRISSIGAVEDGDNPPAEIVLFKRNVSTEERERLASRGQALPDGSFPIANVSDLRNAIQAIGRAKNPGRARAHIIRRAKALGQTGLIPDGWNVSKIADISPDRADLRKGSSMELDLSTVDDELRVEIEKAFAGLTERIAELESDGPEDITKGMSPEAVARFEELEKKAADQAAELAKERDERLTVEWVGKAREFESILGKAEDAAPHLKQLPDATATWLLGKLAAAETALEASPLFKELGGGDDGTPARDQIEALAIEKRKDNDKLSMPQARALVRKEHPELKQQEREEAK